MDSLADTADTAGDCDAVVGSGCAALREPVTDADCSSSSGVSADTRESLVVEGGGCRCDTAHAPSMLALLFAAFVFLRRRAPLFALLLLCDPAWAGVNAQTLKTRDGGEWPALHEAVGAPPWSASAALATHYSRGLVVLVDGERERVLLEQVLTTELSGSVQLGRYLKLGLAIPRHNWVVFDGELTDEPRRGDIALWTTIHIMEPQTQGPALSWSVVTEFSTGDPDVYLGDPGGSVMGLLAGEAPIIGPLRGAANLGLKLRSNTPIPGTVWGNRLEYGVGLSSRVAGPVHATGEIFGSTPIRGTSTPAAYPVEALGSMRVELPRQISLAAGGGTGLTRGVGSPSMRFFVMVDRRPRPNNDRDGDGIDDGRDSCPDDPEDRDGFEDRDGCPDDDNDADGFVDREDTCPNEPEVFNDYRDIDGCPDRLTTVNLTVVSSDPELEQVRLQLGEFPETGLIPSETASFELPPAEYSIRVTGDGHHDHVGILEVPHEEWTDVEVVLSPILFGQLSVRLESGEGEPLAGFVRSVEHGLIDVAATGVTLELVNGEHELLAVSNGYTPQRFTVVIADDVDRVVVLEPSGLLLEDNQILLEDTIEFELDQSVLLPESHALLDEVAALLLATTSIELLRVEGHADEMGSSRYNHELSSARAGAVVAYLVDAGVERDRLEPLGTGEAEPLDDGARSRRVSFTVIVWDDREPPPEMP
ncbi:MAG: OmpA family protein [Proteobacteria bacterium]|nr:OmpA family protein [Pseudomonadota bacterium]